MDESDAVEMVEEETYITNNDNRFQLELLECLSSVYVVLRKIFSFLYLEDIVNAAEAFDSWKAVAEITRKERSCIESFVVSEDKYKMSKIWSEAIFCICFCSSPNKELEEKIAKFIRPNGEFLHCLSGAGVIGTVHDLSRIVQLKFKVELSRTPKMSCLTTLRIPNVPDVGVKTFYWEDDMDFEEFKKGFDIPMNQTIKCLLILMIAEGTAKRANKQIDDFTCFLQSRQKESFAIGGGVIDNFTNSARTSAANSAIKYIVFYGDNIEAASIVLTADIRSRAGVNSKIKKFREMSPVTKKGALFVFRCAGRQRVTIRGRMSTHYDITQHENRTIQEHFPNTPVVGCFSYGEFGTEHPYNDGLSPFRMSNSYEFSFSTSLVYIGLLK